MIKKFKIGHYTNTEQGTGCTVILCPEGTKASAYARGVAPGTREYALLSPKRKVEDVHAILLTGGSAFGLDAAAGVMRFLAERGIGHPTPFRNIPIVPAAVIYDLYMVDSKSFPTPENAYDACKSARANNPEQGSVGAGTGATVGKWAGLEFAMKGGVGIAEIEFGDLKVEALMVLNSVGDVVDGGGSIVAGAQQNGKFLAEDDPAIRWRPRQEMQGFNTVLGVVMTNGDLSKQQLHHLAERSHNGIVRSVVPAHTSFDGDVIFALGTGETPVEIDTVTEMAVEAVRRGIVNSVSVVK
jgi:L-aminopeptidase/D-esterase-like protein